MDIGNFEAFELVKENMIFAQRRLSRKVQRGIRDGSLLSISRGAFLPARIIAGKNRFEVNRIIHLARAQVALQRNQNVVLGGPTALMAAGVDQLWETSLDVVLYSTEKIDYRRRVFPPVILPDGQVIPVGNVHVTCVDAAIGVVPILNSAIQCVRLLPPEQGFISFIMAAQVLARCDRSDLSGSCSRIESLRQVCQEIHQKLEAHARGRERLRKAAVALTGPVESVLEARMLWLLFTESFEGYVTQYPIEYWGGFYYPDFAFPDHRLVLELDGQVKYQGTDFDRQLVLSQEAERQAEIVQQGWSVLRFGWKDFQCPKKVALALESALLG